MLFFRGSDKSLQNGERARVPIYDFTTHRRVGEEMSPVNPDVVMIDGIFVVYEQTVRYDSA